MGKGIKTRLSEKKGIKAIDKAAVASERMKEAYIRTKDKADHSLYAEENSPGEYASDRFSAGADNVTHEAVHQFDKQGRKGVQTTRENISKVKENIQKRKAAAAQPKKQAEKQAARKTRQAADRISEPVRTLRQERGAVKTLDRGKKSIKTVDRGRKTIKQASSTAKGTVKTASKSIKTAEKTAKASIKTTQQAAKAAQRTAQATARAARAAAHAARAAARAAVVAAKVAAKATIAAVKAIIAATKALIAAIAAGGWIAVLVIVIICLIGLLIGSCFGIFFSGEDSGSGYTVQNVVQEINDDYQQQIDTTKANLSHDVLEMSGSRAVWPEVLAVYAVKTTTDPDNPQEVATIDDSKKAILTDIFWEMNQISSRTETRTETVIIETDDGHGNIVETETTVTQTYLYITVSHKTAEEMAEQYGFDKEQKEQLAELLAEENRSLWSAVLYGIYTEDGAIVSVALSQVGNVGGEPYWSWYGFSGRVEWCACFVSWCANECGYIDTGVIPKYAGCVNGVQWFKDRGQWMDGSAEPAPGMIIFFDWDDENGQDGLSDHTGIVEKVENGRVYTIEGNSGDSVRQNSYPVGHYEVLGYGCPDF
ncbi:CHAP domain-containing protein [[Clostridium] innocuum]|nr:CHAP domain-containing protein [[Clostridium] innocuum]